MNPQNKTSRRGQEGFTLVEILVAIAILGILGSIAIREVFVYIDEAKQTATKSKVDSLDGIVRDFKRRHSELPSSLEVLTQEDDRKPGGGVWCAREDIKDAWDHPMELVIDQRGNFEIVSYGENGEPDGYTNDLGWNMDISSRLPLGGEDE